MRSVNVVPFRALLGGMKFRRFLLVSALATGTAHAQQSPAPPASSAQGGSGEASSAINTLDAVKVTASRGAIEPGAAIGTIRPEVQLGRMEVQSYGASTVEELLGLIAPMTTSDSGDSTPIVLLNGKRISGMQEIKDIPTEAIRRVDVLPEEEALLYGYLPTQKVVNVVLVPRFNRYTAQLDGSRPSAGGMETGVANLDRFILHDDDRLNLDLKYTANTMLTEDERDIATVPVTPGYDAQAEHPLDPRAVRSLANANHALDGNAVWSKALGDRTSLALNYTGNLNDSDGKRGYAGTALLVPADDPFAQSAADQMVYRYVPVALRQHAKGWSSRLGGTLNHDFDSDWHLSVVGYWSRSGSRTVTDAGVDKSTAQALLDAGDPDFDPYGFLTGAMFPRNAPNIATSLADAKNLQVLLHGTLLALPAGDAIVSLGLADTDNRIDNVALMGGRRRVADFSRNDANASASIELPLTSRSYDVLGMVGDLSVNAHALVDHLSDYGQDMRRWGYGLRWSPLARLTFTGNVDTGKTAPTPAQLANPVITSTGTHVFDYATGQTVSVTSISGGNPDLLASSQHRFRAGISYKPFDQRRLSIVVNYTDTDTRNPISSLPPATAALQAALSDRYIADDDGNLAEVDSRPLNFAEQKRRQLRFGFNDAHSVDGFFSSASSQPDMMRGNFPPRRSGNGTGGDTGGTAGDAPSVNQSREGQGEGGGGGRGFGSGGRGFGGGMPPSLLHGQIVWSLYDTVVFSDRVLVRNGMPWLDLLGGDAIGSGGGVAHHQIDGSIAYTRMTYGVRLSFTSRSGTRTEGGAVDAGDLDFSGLTTFNLRAFANFNRTQLAHDHPWLRGTRVTLTVNNLLDKRVKVVDGTGTVPASYQPDLLDPVGRLITLSLRKQFQ